jgi:Sec20
MATSTTTTAAYQSNRAQLLDGASSEVPNAATSGSLPRGGGGKSTTSSTTNSSAGGTTQTEAAHIHTSLMRTKQLLQSELQRVSAVSAAISHDETVLQQTAHEQKTLNTAGAQQALTSLQRAQQFEHRVLMASILFFYLVVSYIVYERILYPLGFRLAALLYLPTRVFSFCYHWLFIRYFFDGTVENYGGMDNIRMEL